MLFLAPLAALAAKVVTVTAAEMFVAGATAASVIRSKTKTKN